MQGRLVDLIRGEIEIEDGEGAEDVLVVEFFETIFLDADADVAAMNFQVGFDHPVMFVVTHALKQKRVGPAAPGFVGIDVPLGAADGFVDEGAAAGETDAAGGERRFPGKS